MKRTFDLAGGLMGLHRDGTAKAVVWKSGPPPRIDGYTVGAPHIRRDAPHGGEQHPDGDELLYLVSGRLDVVLEEDGLENTVELHPGDAFVVPKGIWHRVVMREPSQLIHITPGPGGQWRPKRR
jgi:quercetin dioxygenase-like cupin family protein